MIHGQTQSNGVRSNSTVLLPMLTGPELLSFATENAHLDQGELAKATGYYRITESGKERMLTKQMCEALLEAKGMSIKSGKRPGKSAQYATTVHRNGVILVGKTYSEKFGVEPGDVLDIIIEEDEIRLVPKTAEVAKPKGKSLLSV